MPRYLRTTAELRELPAYFEVLATVPYIETDDAVAHDNCGICREPFRWQRRPGEALNQPVRLFCGHVFGIQCLAHCVFSPTFDGRCFFCRKIILDPTRPVVRHPKLDIIRAQVDFLVLFQGQIPARTKIALQSCFRTSISGRWSVESLPEEVPKALEDNHRLMILWEELLDTMCDEPETEAEQQERAQLVNQDDQNQRNQIAPEHLAATLRFLETPLRLLATLLQWTEALIQPFATPIQRLTELLHFMLAPLQFLLPSPRRLAQIRLILAEIRDLEPFTRRQVAMRCHFFLAGVLVAYQFLTLWDISQGEVQTVFFKNSIRFFLSVSTTMSVLLLDYEQLLTLFLLWATLFVLFSFTGGYALELLGLL